MKKILLTLTILVIMSVVFVSCGNNNNEPSENNNIEPTGEILEGERVINIGQGFSDETIEVYRGETIHLIYSNNYTGETQIIVEGHDIDEVFPENSVKEVIFKVGNVGEYNIKVIEAEEEIGLIDVTDYEKENIFANLDNEEFKAKMVGDFLLLDVRTRDEYMDGNIEGSILIPVSELEGRLDEIENFIDKPVLVYCRSGNRSIVAAQILINNGFTEVYNLTNGFSRWTN